MTVTVEVVDDTGLVGEPEAVARLVEAVLEGEGVDGEVVVAFVDEARMADLNCRYRGLAAPTDVLAFDYAAAECWPGEMETAETAGEVLVCPHTVMRYAAEEGRVSGAQLGWTLVHGALHLAGYDHEIDEGEMRDREQSLLERFELLVRPLSLAGKPG